MTVRTRPRTVAASMVALVFSLALVAGACGGSSDSSDDASDSNSGAVTGTVPPTTDDDSSSRRSTTTTEAGTTPDEATIPGAEIFVDPEGKYTLEVDPSWEGAAGTVVSGVELWYIGTGTPATLTSPEFRDNINVLEQKVGGGVDLQDYIDASIANLGGLELLDSGTITGAYGQELGYIEYKGMVPTAPIPVHVLATFIIADGEAILATLTSTEDTAADAQATAGDYLLTLMPTGTVSGGSNGA